MNEKMTDRLVIDESHGDAWLAALALITTVGDSFTLTVQRYRLTVEIEGDPIRLESGIFERRSPTNALVRTHDPYRRRR